jgi:hypothetical protein
MVNGVSSGFVARILLDLGALHTNEDAGTMNLRRENTNAGLQ